MTKEERQVAVDAVKAQYREGRIPEATMIQILAGISKQSGGDTLKLGGVTITVPAMKDNTKDKKDRNGNVIEYGVEKVDGGKITISGKIDGKPVQTCYVDAPLFKLIVDNLEEVLEFLSEEDKQYRKLGQTRMSQGSLSADMFNFSTPLVETVSQS